MAAIDDLVRFMRRDDLPVLTQAAIAHAQFETIHPFPDGNGRTGRAIVHCLLRGKRLTRHVTVPISAGLLTDTERYFDALTAYRTGDIQPIIERFAEASFDSIVNGRELGTELGAMRELDVSAMGAEAALTELVEIGALKEVTGGRRNRRYAALPVLAALDAFVERAGRRTR